MLTKLHSYALFATAIVLAVVGVYWRGVRDGVAKVESKIDSARLNAALEANKIERSVDALSDTDLRDRAGKWVR